jgi:hypothetical protein
MLTVKTEAYRGFTVGGRTFARISRITGHRGQWQKQVSRSVPPYDQVWADYGSNENDQIENEYMNMKEYILLQNPIPFLEGGYSAVLIMLSEPFYEYMWPYTGVRHAIRRIWVKDNDHLDDASPWMVYGQARAAASSSRGR